MSISVRTAGPQDLVFIVEGIIQAEKSGGDILPYTALFDISEAETRQLISDIMDEEISGQEWHLPHFRILFRDGEPAACLSAWIEGAEGSPSGLLKAQAMAWFLGGKWQAASDRLEQLKNIQLPRLTGALQLECIYTAPGFRGQGLAGILIEHTIREFRSSHPEMLQVEIQLLSSNDAALRSYTKCGFLKRTSITSPEPEILTLLPDNTRVSLVKDI